MGVLGSAYQRGLVVGAVVIAMSAAGASRAVTAIRERPAAPGETVKTGSGVFAVEHAEVLSGLTPRALSGATHGINGLVREANAQVRAAVTITNLGSVPLPVSPKDFELLVGSRPEAPSGATFAEGMIQPKAAIEGALTFVVPRDGRKLAIRFVEPVSKRTSVVELRVRTNPLEGKRGHHH